MKNLLIPSVILILSVSLFNCSNNKSVNEIYINSKTGNDANPGTEKKPLKSISEVSKRIQAKPANILLAGDQVYEGTRSFCIKVQPYLWLLAHTEEARLKSMEPKMKLSGLDCGFIC
jgi:hypothetical protein